jgi:hypothetical protein
MDTLIKFVGQQLKEIRKIEKLMTRQRTREFIHAQNYRYDTKTQQVVPKKNQKFNLLQEQDYDGDGIDDIVVTKEGKVYYCNGFFHKILITHYVDHF